MLTNRWRMTLAGLTLALTLVTVMLPLVAGADHLSPNAQVPNSGPANEGPFWESYLETVRGIEDASCTKISQNGSTAFVMPAEPVGEDWVLVVIKQGETNFVYYDPDAGHSYPSVGQNAPGFSHVIVCSVEEQVTTTTVDDTTTTTVDDTTTTTADDTTTTTVDDTTTTTADDTTTTTVGDTTTTIDPGTTTTIDDEVLGTIITSTTIGTPSTIADEVAGTTIVAGELPFTGFDGEMFGQLALAILVLGLLTLLVAKSVRAWSNDES
jgi:hypothetical protein